MLSWHVFFESRHWVLHARDCGYGWLACVAFLLQHLMVSSSTSGGFEPINMSQNGEHVTGYHQLKHCLLRPPQAVRSVSGSSQVLPTGLSTRFFVAALSLQNHSESLVIPMGFPWDHGNLISNDDEVESTDGCQSHHQQGRVQDHNWLHHSQYSVVTPLQKSFAKCFSWGISKLNVFHILFLFQWAPGQCQFCPTSQDALLPLDFTVGKVGLK